MLSIRETILIALTVVAIGAAALGAEDVQVTTVAIDALPVLEPSKIIIQEDDQPRERIVSYETADGPRSVAIIDQNEVNLWALAAWHSRYWLGVIVVCILVWLSRKVWRASRRSQDTGEFYCRRCNYQLTGVASRTCPECGAPLDNDNRVRGRPRVGRVLRPIAAILLLLAVYFVLGWSELPRSDKALHVFEWHSPTVYAWLKGSAIVRPATDDVTYFKEYDPAANTYGQIIYRQPNVTWHALRVPDSDDILITDYGSVTRWNLVKRKKIFETVAFKRNRPSWCGNTPYPQYAVTSDGKSLRSIYSNEFVEWDLATGKAHQVEDKQRARFLAYYRETAPRSGLFTPKDWMPEEKQKAEFADEYHLFDDDWTLDDESSNGEESPEPKEVEIVVRDANGDAVSRFHVPPVRSSAFPSDGRLAYLGFADRDHGVEVRDLSTGRLLRTLAAPGQELKLSGDDHLLFDQFSTLGGILLVEVWDEACTKRGSVLSANRGMIDNWAHSNQSLVLTASEGLETYWIETWSVHPLKHRQTILLDDSYVTDFYSIFSGRYLFVSLQSPDDIYPTRFCICDMERGEWHRLELPDTFEYDNVNWNRDSHYVVLEGFRDDGNFSPMSVRYELAK